MNSFDDEIWRLIGELDPYIDKFDDELARLENGTDYAPLKAIVADLLFDLKPHLDPSVHELISSYRDYWHGNTEEINLNDLQEQTRTSVGHKDILYTMGFLGGDEIWRTQQDGVGFYVCWMLRRAGVDSFVLRQELERQIAKMSTIS